MVNLAGPSINWCNKFFLYGAVSARSETVQATGMSDKRKCKSLFSAERKKSKKNHSTVVDTKIIHRVGFSVWILVTCFELVRGLGKHNFLKLSIYFSVSCGSKVNNTLKSPAYSDGFYAGNMNCSYNVSIPDGKALRLKFQTFDLEGSDSGCR